MKLLLRSQINALQSIFVFVKNIYLAILFNSVTEYFFCEYNDHKKYCEQAWQHGNEYSLYIPPKRYSFFEKKLVGAPYKNFCNQIDWEFSYYGHGYAFYRHANLIKFPKRKITAEHGIILSGIISRENIERYKKKLVLVFSTPRRNVLEQNGVVAKAIGPYIHYAKLPVPRERFEKLRENLGRTLVHFPLFGPTKQMAPTEIEASSWVNHDRVDHQLSAETLARWRSKGLIDTVVICYRWSDLVTAHQDIHQYKKLDAISACCGTILNPFFLDHLRMLMELSSISTSNVVSTPLGNSLYLGKPHFIIGNQDAMKTSYKQHDQVSVHLYDQFYRSMDCSHLEVPSEEVSNDVADLWGFSNVHTPGALRDVLIGGRSS